jgi:hypothetical protein
VQQPKNQPTPRRTELRHGAFLVDAGVALGVVLGVELGVVLGVVLGVARSSCAAGKGQGHWGSLGARPPGMRLGAWGGIQGLATCQRRARAKREVRGQS